MQTQTNMFLILKVNFIIESKIIVMLYTSSRLIYFYLSLLCFDIEKLTNQLISEDDIRLIGNFYKKTILDNSIAWYRKKLYRTRNAYLILRYCGVVSTSTV